MIAYSSDIRRVLLAQAVRAFAYGFSAVLLGVYLEARDWDGTQVGLLLAAIVAGSALSIVAVGTFGDRIGRRLTYGLLFAALAAAGIVFAVTDEYWVLVAVALTGALSTEVVESGPFTTLEQSMLSGETLADERARMFAVYNAVATISGSVGALAAGGPAVLRDVWGQVPADQRFFLALVPAGLCGMLLAASLSRGVELQTAAPRAPLTRSRRAVSRLAMLFSVDAFAGGFVLQTFIAYWFKAEFDVSTETIAAVFFAVGILQSVSFFAAARISRRIGLLNTMVFTHIPSNVLLMAIPLAPSLPVAISLLLGRFALSQMDVPARQAYIASLVEPEERTAAVAYTNTARYAARPMGAVLAGAAQQVTLGMAFFLGGGIKIAYDLTVWRWFRSVPLRGDEIEGKEETRA